MAAGGIEIIPLSAPITPPPRGEGEISIRGMCDTPAQKKAQGTQVRGAPTIPKGDESNPDPGLRTAEVQRGLGYPSRYPSPQPPLPRRRGCAATNGGVACFFLGGGGALDLDGGVALVRAVQVPRGAPPRVRPMATNRGATGDQSWFH